METEPLTILAIDDNRDNLFTLQAVLRDLLPGVRLLTALNGWQGLELAQVEDPDVVLLDIVMPGMDGFAVCRELRADERLRAIPVIFLTALKTGRESRIEALEVGAEGFLAKPLDEIELVAQIRAMAKVKAANQRQRLEKEHLAMLVAERTRDLEHELAERVQAEEQLRHTMQQLAASEKRQRTIIETEPECVKVLAPNGALVEMNRAGLDMIEADSLEQVQGQSVLPLVAPEYRQAFRAMLKSVMHGNKEMLTFEIIGLKGTHRWLETHSAPLRDAEDKVTGLLGVARDITKRKKLEADLVAERDKFDFILRELPVGVSVLDADHKFIYVNPASIQIDGYPQSPESLLGQHVTDHYPKNNRTKVAALLDDLASGKKTVFTREARRGKRTVEISYHARRDAQGHYRGVVRLVSDISERKQAEEVIRRAEQRYRELFEDAPVMYVITRNVAGAPIITDCNQLFWRTLGYRYDELVGRPLADMYTPSSRAELLEGGGYQRALVGVFTADERELQACDGRIIPCILQAVPEVDATGQVTGTRAMFMDITERKQAEEQIGHLLNQQVAINRIGLLLGKTLDVPSICRIAHQELQGIVDAPHFGIFLYDEITQEIAPLYIIGDGQPIDVSNLPRAPLEPGSGPQSRAIVTRQPDIVDDLLDQLPQIKTHIPLPTQDRRQVRSVLTVPMLIEERVIGTVQLQSYSADAYSTAAAELLSGIANQVALAIQNATLLAEIRQHAADLELRVAERTAALQARVAQVEQLNQEMHNILGNLQNANRRAEQTARRLEQTNAELESFSYSVSHDLRAPLRGIDGWSLALLEDYGDQLDDQAHRYLDRVRAEAQRMGELIDDLLALSRVGRMEMQRKTVDLSALAQTIAARLQEEEPQRRVEFVIQAGVRAHCDAHLLDIAFTNLLKNAFKFSGPRPMARIEFGQIEFEGRAAYFVRDNGVGFDMAYASKLFGAFQRLHSPAEFPGTGVGLATVQRVIRRHGGRVWAEAEVDKGATFYFTLEEKA